MRKASVVLSGAMLAAAAGTSSAAIHVWSFTMDGTQEVPSNLSPAIGSATVTLDDVTGAVSLTGSYSGLLGAISAAHIHGLAPPGVNAGVILGLSHSGGITGTLSGAGILTPAQVTGMIDGLTYVNVHSQAFPGGEIRGQVVPTPGALATLALGGLLATRRRR